MLERVKPNLVIYSRGALLLILVVTSSFDCQGQQNDLQWQYIPIDSTKQKWGDWDNPEWLRYFGADAGDINRDGLMDIVSGRYIYMNPGGDMTGNWERIVLDDNVDIIFTLNVDDDPYADLIVQALPMSIGMKPLISKEPYTKENLSLVFQPLAMSIVRDLKKHRSLRGAN